MKGILSEDKQTIKGPVTMDEPDCWDYPITSTDRPCSKCERYKQHLASLPSIPAIGFEGHEPGEVEYVEDVRFEVCQEVGDQWGQQVKIPVTYAIPSPQGEKNGTIWGKMKKDIDYLESIKLTEYGQGAYDALKKLYDEFPTPTTHSLTTEQLVAMWEAGWNRRLYEEYGCPKNWMGKDAPDMKTYLKEKLNIDIP